VNLICGIGVGLVLEQQPHHLFTAGLSSCDKTRGSILPKRNQEVRLQAGRAQANSSWTVQMEVSDFKGSALPKLNRKHESDMKKRRRGEGGGGGGGGVGWGGGGGLAAQCAENFPTRSGKSTTKVFRRV
jgi:hypothetical protein